MPEKRQLDPQFVPIYEYLRTFPPMAERSIDEVRSATAAMVAMAREASPPEAVESVRELSIPVAGAAIAGRLYLPAAKPPALIVYYHGGGWTFGSIETHDGPLRSFANLTGAAVLSIDYRLAPEHPYPTPFEDAYTALSWASDHLAEFTGGPALLVVGGDSAGGNLAATVALASRDRDGPQLAGQILIYPSINGRCDAPSYTEHANCDILTGPDMKWYWQNYAPDMRLRLEPSVSPSEAASHRDLPPAIVAVAEHDPLRDDGFAYADQLLKAGNRVTLLHFETLPHGFFNFTNDVGAAKSAVQDIARSACGLWKDTAA
jgi:acetyl esterase